MSECVFIYILEVVFGNVLVPLNKAIWTIGISLIDILEYLE